VHDLDVDAFADVYDDDQCDMVNSSFVCSGTPFNLFDASLNFDGIGGEGVLGTLQVGYDWQFDTRGVFGVFADADLSGISSDLDFSASVLDDDFALSGSGEIDMDWMWTIGARLGYLTTPDTMIYVLLGYTQAEFDDANFSLNFNDELAGLIGANAAQTVSTNLDSFSGYSVGAGIETRLNRNWGVKLEYRYTELSSEELFSVNETFDVDGDFVEVGASAEVDPSIHTGRVALTYRFNRARAPIEPVEPPMEPLK
jgi:outer membrane immunogenic protein